MRLAWTMGLAVAMLAAGLGWGRASDRDETTVSVVVSAADHEVVEGYFSLGEAATVVVRPGSELHRFLARQRGHKVKVVLSEEVKPELTRLER